MQIEIVPGMILNVNLDAPIRTERNNPMWPSVCLPATVQRMDNSMMMGEHVGQITINNELVAYVSRSVVGFAFDIQFVNHKGRHGKMSIAVDFKEALIKAAESAVEWAAAEYMAPPDRK